MLADRHFLKKKWYLIGKIRDSDQQQQALSKWHEDVEISANRLNTRLQQILHINYPDLPVSDKRDDIMKLIESHQVVIVAGETGSGKTTQLPKMCLQLGRGRSGMIAHTQPRRLAARSVAARIAEEMQTELGEQVGYKVRFTDKVSDQTLVKLLTDGMLLAEIQQDKFLNQYDTIIIDEAHERSLNIDFLLGYILRILPKRPDLKVIITSATIDPQRFSKHFNNAPVIEVSGRGYPVEIRHRDYLEEVNAQDQIEAIELAVDELSKEKPGDILVFLSSEREIRETQKALEKNSYRNTEVIPLYARLSASDQQKIFHPKGTRRIVLSTNVAETSLTVPGIKYVIDSGFVRMSRYSHRLKVQRLPIEPISQASAKQRAGRCGRTSSGICIRLYSEQDYISRDEFTDPEITRTHLSSVILQMLSLGLGEIDRFEFIQPPEHKFIKDGVRLLEELQAVHTHKNRLALTAIGRKMARLPLDPKYARMLIAASDYDCVYEVMIITAGLSVQDPRERPHEQRQKADEAHNVFSDKESDLISLYNLYETFKSEQKNLSQNQLRKWCSAHFINYQRMREWQDIVHQIKHMLVSVDLRLNSKVADYQAIHSSIATGLLAQLGLKDTQNNYQGARNSQFKIFPGSALFKQSPKWIMAAEMVETSQLFARQVAKIEPNWLEEISQQLLKSSYVDVHWSKKRGAVMAYMNSLLYGLPIVNRRLVNYSQIDTETSRQLFIRHALVQVDTKLTYQFLSENQALVEDVETLEKKIRRRDILVDEEDLVDFYDEKIPHYVCSEVSFKKWWQSQQKLTPQLLNFEKSSLFRRDVDDINQQQFPDYWQQGQLVLPLTYEFEPNQIYDGVCVNIPIEQLNQVQNIHFDFLVRGLRHELLVALIKSLPKRLRRNFVPAPDYASACLDDLTMTDKSGSPLTILQALSEKLFKMTGVKVHAEDFELDNLPNHLTFNFAAVDSSGKIVAIEKSLIKLKQKLKGQLKKTIDKVATFDIEQSNITTFNIDELPEVFSQTKNGFEIKAYPALVKNKQQVDVKLFTSIQEARQHHVDGVVQLIKINVPSPIKYLQQKLPNKAKLSLYFNPFGQINLLIDDIVDAAIYTLIQNQGGEQLVRQQRKYREIETFVRMDLNDTALEISKHVESGLSIANEVQKHLKGSIGLNLINQVGNIKTHLNRLVYKGFVYQLAKKQPVNTLEALNDWNRYLKALLQRCEKLKIDPTRDRINQLELDKAESELKKVHDQFVNSHKDINQLTIVDQYIEEFRVSLFAQQLGTKYPISLKRIRNKLDDIVNNG